MHPVRKPSEARVEPREEVIDNPELLDLILPGGPGCPLIADLIDRARDCLPGPRAAEVDDHLETCDVCRGHVAGFASSAGAAEARGQAPRTAGMGEVWGQVREGPAASPEGSRPLARALARLWRDIRREARARAEQRLTLLVAELGERLRANVAWLFDRRGEELQAIVTHRSRMRHLVMRVGERGIVPHVAETRAGYLSNDVANDPHYRPCIPDTRSELAVPVIALDGDLVGVLNLESRQVGTFRAAQVEELQAAASVLIPHLRVLADLDECPWHPEVHGWDLTQIFQRFCLAVVQGLNQPDGEDTASCTIWYADWAKDELFVYATSGYDIEYISELTLPMDSFCGRVAAGPPG
jgi:hypothetical protein